MKKAEFQMAEEKNAEKNMAEKRFFSIWSNGPISIGGMLKWPNPDQVDFHSRARVSVHWIWIRPISPFVWLRKDYRVVLKFFIPFKKNHEFCMNLNFFYIFRNIGRINSFRPFELWP
jgi:hypothetical protein